MTNRQYEVRLPMRISTSSRKKTALNLNVYRNLHFRSLNSLKNKFHRLSEKLLKDIPPLGRIRLHYSIHPKSKRRLDIMNFGSVVDKFFSDCLTEYGIIKDDDFTQLDFASFGFGGLAKEEYILVTITEIEPREENAMRILLDQSDIQIALEDFVSEQGINGATGVLLSADDDGNITAEVLMDNEAPSQEDNEPNKTKKRAKRRTKAEMQAAKEAEANVATSTESSSSGDSEGAGDTPDPKAEQDTASDSETKNDGKSSAKNLFTESQEASSTEGDSVKTEEDSDQEVVKPAKKSSIFDQ